MSKRMRGDTPYAVAGRKIDRAEPIARERNDVALRLDFGIAIGRDRVQGLVSSTMSSPARP